MTPANGILRYQAFETVHERGADRPVVVSLAPGGLLVGLRGLAGAFPVSYAAVYSLAVKQAAPALPVMRRKARR